MVAQESLHELDFIYGQRGANYPTRTGTVHPAIPILLHCKRPHSSFIEHRSPRRGPDMTLPVVVYTDVMLVDSTRKQLYCLQNNVLEFLPVLLPWVSRAANMPAPLALSLSLIHTVQSAWHLRRPSQSAGGQNWGLVDSERRRHCLRADTHFLPQYNRDTSH
jgi:hypothetical protein